MLSILGGAIFMLQDMEWITLATGCAGWALQYFQIEDSN